MDRILQILVGARALSCEVDLKERHDGLPCGILEALQREQWDAEDKPCLDATLEMLNGVKNSTLWATWIWDSMERPSGVLYGSRYQLGNFDQCIKPPWLKSHPHLRTQYCLADISLTDVAPQKSRRAIEPNDPTELYINNVSTFGKRFNVMTWGVCLSDRCSAHAITKFMQTMLKTQHLPRSTSQIKVHSCQLAGATTEYSFGFKAFLFIILFLVVLLLVSMWYLRNMKPETFATRLARSFCITRNWNFLVRTNDDEIQVLNCIRFLSAIFAVVAHHIITIASIPVSNGLEIFEQGTMSKAETMMLRADLVVDTFFLMSGLFLVKCMVRHQELAKGNLMKLLWSRYVRLIGLQAFMVIYYANVSTYVGDGPLWPLLSKQDAEYCSNNWPSNLLMINNYVNPSNMCQVLSWSNACDFQFAIFGTMLYWVYQKKPSVGLRLGSVAFLLSLLLPGLVTYWYRLPTLLLFDIEHIGNVRENPVFLGTYVQSHNRVCVYIIGIILGHIMTFYKPNNYRKSIPVIYSLPCALIALYIMERIANLGASMAFNEYHPLAEAIFVSTHRAVWGLALALLIICCEYGTVAVIGDFLKINIAVPLSRLSYGVYMTHLAIVYYINHTVRAPIRYNFSTLIIISLGVITLSYFISFLLWFLLEAPLVNISNVFLDAISQNKKQKVKTTKVFTSNGDKINEAYKNA